MQVLSSLTITIIGTSLVFGCTSPKTSLDTSNVDSALETGLDGTQCVNTFEPTQMPDQQITEFGTEIPTLESVLPEKLSETELYVDIVQREIHPAIRLFKPQYELWSDGEDKRRWVYIPECEKIDSSNMNDWSFPVGTRFFKEFSVGNKKVETRYIERLGPGEREFVYVSYLWNEEQTEAFKVSPEGMQNVLGTEHDIPSWKQCVECHGTAEQGGGRPSRGLGFSAIMLSEVTEGISLQELVDMDALSDDPENPISIPGDQINRDALGYMHVNCGPCHNQSKDGLPMYDLNLWLDVGTASPEDSNAWRTTVGVDTQVFKDQHVLGRVVPGNPMASAIYYRMIHRDDAAQMPPLATSLVDEEGASAISAWIESLP